MFSNIQIKNYRENKGKLCPYCGEESISTINIGELKIINPDRATQRMKCKSCKKEWIEIYPMFEIEEVEEENEKTGDR